MSDYLDLLEKALRFDLWPEPLKPVSVTSDPSLKAKVARAVDRFTRKFGVHLGVYDRHGKWPVLAHTMLSRERLNNVRALCEVVEVEGLEGSWVECGVWRGGASILARACLKDREVYICDTFNGLPVDYREPQWAGYYFLKVPLNEVIENFMKYGLYRNVIPVIGPFDVTLKDWKHGPIAILRADADMYSSTKAILENLYQHVTPGGFVIIDDYWLGPCRLAVTEFLREHELTPSIVPIDNEGIWWRKT